MWTNTKVAFTTGINIFGKQEQEKLQERAKRFALRPEEINSFTDADLQQLHYTLGITAENASNVRFDAVHLLGLQDMTPEDVLDYFGKYAPSSIEWVSMESCNVIWLDKISAARAMFYCSKVVKGMPVRAAFPKDVDMLDDDEGDDMAVGLITNKNREVSLKEDEDIQSKIDFRNAAQIEDITIPIPPGYWRLGNNHEKSKCILLRYAFKTDKQPYKIESLAKYYKKLGSQLLKKKESKGIFDRNKDLSNKDKNPWGVLARNWDEDSMFREREPIMPEEVVSPVKIKNPSILVRLGKKTEVPDEKLSSEESSDDDEEADEKKSKSKIPRMRMYADEEEAKMKRKKVIQTLKKQTEKLEEDTKDLRNVLGVTHRRMPVMDMVSQTGEHEQSDLGLRLKNRNKQMVFAVDRTDFELDQSTHRNEPRSDARSFLDRRRKGAVSPRRSRLRSPEFKRAPLRRKSPYRSYRSRTRSRSPDFRRRRNISEEKDTDNHHSEYPRSKVAVVIKTQKKPAVASTVWSRVKRPEKISESSQSDEESSESEESSSSESSKGEDIYVKPRGMRSLKRPGFNQSVKSRLSNKIDHKNPLKIEIANDIF